MAASESDDGGDSHGRMLPEIATGNAVGVAVACAVEANKHTRESAAGLTPERR
jgi:hypothetical protein